MMDYLGGVKWAYYSKDTSSATVPNAISDCALANFGLQLAFITEAPMHLLVFETLTGDILYQYRLGTYADSLVHAGIQARNKEETGIFLGYRYNDGAGGEYWNVLELDQSTGEQEWSVAAAIDVSAASQAAGWESYPYDMVYTGKLGTDEYERLYSLGMYENAGGTDALLLISIDTDRTDSDGDDQTPTVPGLIYEWEFDAIPSGAAEDYPAHLYVKYLNVFVCGQSVDAETADGGQPWLQYAVVIKSQEQFEPQIRWQMAEEGTATKQASCAGLYADSSYAFMLIKTDYFDDTTFTFAVLIKDIVSYSTDYLRYVKFGASSAADLIIGAF